MNNIYSFYQLISKYQIEIPIIQRDYAQGRNNVKAADVRKSLVKKMIDAVDDNGKDLFFDFVYGRVDDNKFIPFDGQQRLTTLFLFHKYIFEKCQSVSECSHSDKCICKELLGRFSYATRQSSREFCKKLVENNVIPKDEEKMSEHIKDQSWFYSDWEKDPTVMGMLTMLDEIHNQMRGKENFKSIAEKLTSGCNCPITFHYVDMGEHKLSDETYVKMNARGKQLTPFENFKASLEQYLENKSDISSDWLVSIDGKWLDMFFNVENEGGGKELPDSLMLSFFNRHFMNVWQCCYAKGIKNDKDDELEKFDKRIQKELLLYPSKDDFIPFEIYRYVMDNCGVKNCLPPIFNIWDALCEKDDKILTDCQAVWNRVEDAKSWDLYQGIRNNYNTETYPSRVAFYALMEYFKNKDSVDENKPLSQWMRVVWNIIENSTIDSSDTYHAALNLIEKLSVKSSCIYSALASEFDSFGLGKIYHAQEQVKEEIAKAIQIRHGESRSDGKTWEEVIIDAESYAFFKGAIRFLFQDKNGEPCWDDFGKKWENAKKYFDENGVKDGKDLYKTKSLLMKSLLANCDKFLDKIYWHFEFSNDALRWRRILMSDKWRNSVDVILKSEININTTKEFVNQIKDEQIKNIVDDGLMDFICNEQSGAWIRKTYHGYYALWQSGVPSCQVVINPILSRLAENKEIEYKEDNKIANCRYYKCKNKNVDFKYKEYFFQWYGNPNEKELDVYLMENKWTDYKKRSNPTNGKGTDEDNYYCFRVSSEMVENTTLFTDELNKLIEQANPGNV